MCQETELNAAHLYYSIQASEVINDMVKIMLI